MCEQPVDGLIHRDWFGLWVVVQRIPLSAAASRATAIFFTADRGVPGEQKTKTVWVRFFQLILMCLPCMFDLLCVVR